MSAAEAVLDAPIKARAVKKSLVRILCPQKQIQKVFPVRNNTPRPAISSSVSWQSVNFSNELQNAHSFGRFSVSSNQLKQVPTVAALQESRDEGQARRISYRRRHGIIKDSGLFRRREWPKARRDRYARRDPKRHR
jgi:hypothetical protein